MNQEPRKSGIDIVGDVPWGTHFCHFYHTKEDLLDILVPYFRAGLESDEFCMWVTSEPLEVAEAEGAMARAVPDFRRYLKGGQIEIIPHTDWYLKGGTFDQNRVLNGWVDKLNRALKKGYDGLRLTGNTFWLERNSWKAFAEYEVVVNSVIGNYKMIAICTYSLDKCGASEVIDVVSTHQFALIKREGRWGLIESSEHKQSEEALRKNEERLERSQEIAHLGSWELDLINNKLTWSDEVYRIFGLMPQEFSATYEAFLEAVHPNDRTAVGEAYSSSLREGRDSYEIEHRVIRKSTGEIRVVHEKCQHYRDETGRIVRSVGMVHDITERKKAEAQVAHLASFPQLNPNPVLEVDTAGNIKYANPAAAARFPDLTMQGSKHRFLTGWEDVVSTLSAEEQRFLTREVKVGDSWYEQTVSKVPSDQDLRVYGRDITERKRVEARIQQERDVLEAVTESSNAHIAYLDRDFNFILVNSTYEKGSGHTREELIGRNHFEFFPNPENEAIFKKVRDTGRPIEFRAKPFEFVDQPWRGVTYWDWTLTPVKDESGIVGGLVLSLVDVTEIIREKQLSDALNEIDATINSTLDVGTVIQKVVELSGDGFGCESTIMRMLRGDYWEITHAHKHPKDIIGVRARDEEIPHVWLAKTLKKIVVIDDIYSDERVDAKVMEALGIKSVLVSPLILQDEVIGVLNFAYYSGAVPFSAPQIDFATKLSASVSLALQNAKLYTDERAARRLGEALNNINTMLGSTFDIDSVMPEVLGESNKQIGSESMVLLLHQNREWSVKYVHGLPSELVGMRFREEEAKTSLIIPGAREPVICNDAYNDKRFNTELMKKYSIRSFVGVPLLTTQGVIGSLSFHFHSVSAAFNEMQVDFAKKLATSISLTLQNARLHSQTEEELSKTKLLQDVAAAASASLNLAIVAEEILMALRAHLGLQAGDIKLLDQNKKILKLVASFGYPPETVEMIRSMPLSSSGFLTTDAMKRRQLLTHNNELLTAERIEVLKRSGLEKSRYVVVPILFGGVIVGAFSLAFEGKRDFAQDELGLFETIGNTLGSAIENARLFQAEVEAKRQAADELETSNLLLTAADTLSASLDLRETLKSLADAVLEMTGRKRIIVNLHNEDTREVEVIHSKGEHLPQTGTRFKFAELSPEYKEAFAKRESTVVDYEAPTVSEQARQAGQRFNLKSVLYVPLFTATRVLGLVGLDDPGEKHEFSQREIALAEGIVSQAAMAVQNAQLYGAQYHIAHTLQRSLLPDQIPRIRGLEIKFLYQSASYEAEVGGDFYDIFELPGGLYGVVMGDVAGKGIEVATDTARVRYLLRDRAYSGLSSADVLASVNDALYKQEIERFIALTYGIYDPRTAIFTFSNAGNPYPYMVRGDRFLELTCVPMSILPGEVCNSMEVPLKADDTLIMYTDGLTEARYKGTLYGEERLRRFVKKNKKLPLRQLLKGLVKDAQDFSEGYLPDDVLVIGIRKK